MKTILIGIAGGSASGKTSISNSIMETFKKTNSVAIIKEDDYYCDRSDLGFEERLLINYDHPLAFDHDLLINHLNELIEKRPIKKPTYDFKIYNRSDKYEVINPIDVIILEGLFVLEDEKIRNMLDIKIFVDTESDIRFIRRLLRDCKERGRNIESVVKQYCSVVKPMHERFVEPSKRNADIIIPEGSSNVVAIDLICTKINSIINKKML